MFWLINHKFVSHLSSSKSVVETKLEQKREDGDINVLGLASSLFDCYIFSTLRNRFHFKHVTFVDMCIKD